MTIRTFQQHAQGFGAVPSRVVCQIDGNTVFDGTVASLNEPIPPLPNPSYRINNVAWTWQDDAAFSGTKLINISTTGSQLLLAQTYANNPFDNPEWYSPFFSIEIGGILYKDPFTDPAIDGVAQSGPYDPELTGQWWWIIPANSTFTATMHVNAVSPS